MAKIETIPPSRADGKLEEAYDGIASKSATVANILQVQSLDPEGLEAHYGLYRSLMFGKSPLSRVQRELIAVAVSQANACRY